MLDNSDFLMKHGYYLAVCVKNIEGMKESNTLLAVLDWTATCTRSTVQKPPSRDQCGTKTSSPEAMPN